MLTSVCTLFPSQWPRSPKDVPAGLERIIARYLSIDPADRPQTATELVEALEDPGSISGSLNAFLRDVDDIFAVEDEIADAIVASVSPMAGRERIPIPDAGPTE